MSDDNEGPVRPGRWFAIGDVIDELLDQPPAADRPDRGWIPIGTAIDELLEDLAQRAQRTDRAA